MKQILKSLKFLGFYGCLFILEYVMYYSFPQTTPWLKMVNWILTWGFFSLTVLWAFYTVKSVMMYFYFTEAFDRKPPLDFERRAVAEHVLSCLQKESNYLVGLYETEINYSVGRIRRINDKDDYFIEDHVRTKVKIQTARRNLQRACKAAEFYGYMVPKKPVWIMELKELGVATAR